MAEVKPFDRSMIEHCLREANIKFLRDQDGDFVLQWSASPEIGHDVQSLLMQHGPEGMLYSIYITASGKRIPRDKWDKAILFCNQWNQERYFPTASLRLHESEGTSFGEVVSEQHYPLASGIHQELLSELTLVILSSIETFFSELQKAGV